MSAAVYGAAAADAARKHGSLSIQTAPSKQLPERKTSVPVFVLQIAIIVAEELGLNPTDIMVKVGDSGPGLPSGGSGGSQTTASVAPVIKTAAAAAKQKLFERIAPQLGAPVEDLTRR